jgi:hypothetical protein
MTRPITAIATDLVAAWDDRWSARWDGGPQRVDALVDELREALAQQPTTTRDRLDGDVASVARWGIASAESEHRDFEHDGTFERCGDSICTIARRAGLALAAAPDLSRDAEVFRALSDPIGAFDQPEVHVNTGSAHDRAMAWSEGHTAGYEEGRDSEREDVARHLGLMGEDGETPTKVDRKGRTWVLLEEAVRLVEGRRSFTPPTPPAESGDAVGERCAVCGQPEQGTAAHNIQPYNTDTHRFQPTPPAPDQSPPSALVEEVAGYCAACSVWLGLCRRCLTVWSMDENGLRVGTPWVRWYYAAVEQRMGPVDFAAALAPQVHVNTGSAHDRAMAWSEGHTTTRDRLAAALAYALNPKAHDSAEDPSSPAGHEWAVDRDRARREANRLAPLILAALERPEPPSHLCSLCGRFEYDGSHGPGRCIAAAPDLPRDAEVARLRSEVARFQFAAHQLARHPGHPRDCTLPDCLTPTTPAEDAGSRCGRGDYIYMDHDWDADHGRCYRCGYTPPAR